MSDSAIKSFNAAMARAEYLERLYLGLVDQRKRSARSDWCAKFKSLMHWNMGDVIDRVDSRDAVIVLRNGSSLGRDEFASESLKDVLRASLVLGVSAMDAYFHQKIAAYVVTKARLGNDMPKRLAQSRLSVEAFVRSQSYQRPMNVLRSELENQLGYQSLQQPNQIEKAIGMIGVKSFWSKVAHRINMPVDQCKSSLSQIVERRNQIAHEGDLSGSRKKKNASREIGPAFVTNSLQLIKRVIEASESEINSQI